MGKQYVGLVHNIEERGNGQQFDVKISEAKFELLNLRNEEENHPIVKGWQLRKAISIRKWAEALDGKIATGLWNKSRDWICTEIRRELRTLGFNENEIDYVNQVLPKEYRRESLVREGIGRDISPDFEEITTIGLKDIEVMNPNELQDYLDKNFQIRQINKDRAKTVENNLEVNNDHALSIAEQKGYHVKIPKEEKKETISTIAPLPNKCEAYYAAVDVYNKLIEEKYDQYWYKLAEKLEKYPATPAGDPISPEDKKIAQFIRGKLQTLESESRMLASFTDDKYAQNMWHWFKTIIIEGNYGKHAAAVMSKISPKCGDPNQATTKPRPLTRERVGDIKEKYLKWMYQFGEGMEYYAWWIGVANEWDKEFHSPYNADRRNRESPNLSETAFGAHDHNR